MDYRIEKARPEDAGQMLAFLKAAGGESDNLSFGEEGLPLTEKQEAAYIRTVAKSQKSLMLVAKTNGRIVGSCSVDAFPRRFSHRGELGIVIARECWHQGVGAALMKEAIRFAKEEAHLEVLSLEVRADNQNAIALYEKFGFHRIGTFPKYFKIGDRCFDAELMNLYL
ncbi:MAG TPA: GNAT family N-acetyltransferase [Oscillospiraceae bacterium]|nr:GNAT family N-acetyltransferase [Oscillospiraceae bacterium]